MTDIVIEAPAGDREVQRTMADACSSAVREGRCVLADEGAGTSPARAIVRWENDDASIEVVVEGRGARTRRIRFAGNDPMAERFRAVGLVIATLYGEAVAPPPPPPPPPPAPAPPRAATREHARLFADVGPSLGSGLDAGGPRVGPWLRLALAPWKPPFYASLGVSYAFRAVDGAGLRAHWFTLDVGPRLSLPVGDAFAIEAGLAFAVSLLDVGVTQGSSGDEASRAAVSAAADVAIVIVLGGPVALTFGVRGAAGEATQIRVRNADAVRDSGLFLGGIVGVRFVLWR